MKRIVLIGSGNLAEALARTISDAEELELVQVFARNEERGRLVAQIANTSWENSPQKLATADLYLIAVSDKAVGSLSASLPIPLTATVVHTAGSVTLDTIPAKFHRRAVFYPLQTFTAGRPVDFSKIPVFLETSTEGLRSEMEHFARNFTEKIIYADSQRRAKIHLAGVFACNFANHMYAMGEHIIQGAGLDFEILKPLIGETAAKALDAASPVDVQTGPAIRNDFTTKAIHGEILSSDLRLKNIYSTISQSIWETSKKI